MEAVHRATGERVVELYGSGRTDAGVHAIHQVAHMDLGRAVDAADLRDSINAELPPDINIFAVAPAPPGFHARFSAGARTYLYRISRRRTAFDKPFVWWVQDPLDVAAMARATRALRGFHDFASFARRDPARPDESTTVKVEGVDVFERGDSIFIRITGSHFLWKMVRRVVGVLVEVGRGRLSEGDVLRLLTTESADAAPLTAPPSGLSLEAVSYDVPSVRPPRPRSGFEPRRDAGRGDRPRSGPREGDTRAAEDRRASRWPPRSASPEFPRGRDTRTFRRRG
jgi:tRNA pseudouridine38-40 synthase